MRRTISERRAWLYTYSLGFILLMGLICAIFAVYGKSALWFPDGYYQGYSAFEYISDSLRALFSEGELPAMIDYRLGQGFDALTTLCYYGITEPINIIAGFFTGRSLEIGYAITVIIKVYLTGLFFGCFCREVGAKTGWALGCGALTYAFSGYMLIAVSQHTMFFNGPMMLPLMLLGVEWVLKRKRAYPFVIFAALLLIMNFYYAYVNTLMTAIYALSRLITLWRADGFKRAARSGIKLIACYLLAGLISAAVFLPVISAYLGNGRLDAGTNDPASLLLYPIKILARTFLYFGVPRLYAGNWLSTNYIPTALLCALALIFTRGADSATKCARRLVIIMLICVCVPLAGKIFNGFGYVTNRWIYALTFALCFCAAKMLPEMHKLGSARRNLTLGAAAAYLVACVFGYIFFIKNVKWLALLAPFAGYVAILYLMNARRDNFFKRRASAIQTAYVLASLAMFIVFTFVVLHKGHIAEFVDSDVRAKIDNEVGAAAREIDDPDFYRVAQKHCDDTQALVMDYNGVGYFWSLVPGEGMEYADALDLAQLTAAARFVALGGSADLHAVAAVKYYLAIPADDDLPPHGYELLKSVELPKGDIIDIYQNRFALPIGYAFDSQLAYEDYAKLSPPDKRAALTSAAVVKAPVAGVEIADISEIAVELPFEMSARNAKMSDSDMWVSGDSEITLEFDAPANSEIFVAFENLRMAEGTQTTFTNFIVNYADYRREFFLCSANSVYGYDQIGMAILAGVSGDGASPITIAFSLGDDIMRATFDSIRVYALPVSAYEARVEKLRANGLQNAVVGKNRVTGSIDTENGGILQIAIPYSKGWSAKIDGADAEIFPSGGVYMGVALSAGAHEIELNYRTPWLYEGAYVSAAAILLGVGLMIYAKIRKKREGRA